jgi:hypothetical protein
MAGQGNLILATDYNAIQAKIALVLGSGSGNYGYGQTVLSSAVGSNAKISVTQWANLRTDILRARQHQTGTDLSSQLTTPSTSVKIVESDRAAYMQMADDATTNRLITVPISQATRENLVATTSRTTGWNGTVQQTVTVTFPDDNAARYFFNTGSRIEFSSSLVGGVSDGGKTDSWRTLLNAMQTIYFDYDNTASTNTGGNGITNTNYGFSNLPSANTIIFTKAVDGTTYYPNVYQILARKPSGNQLIFTIQWRDDNSPGGWSIDENVTGTLNSYVQVFRASGSNVSVSTPPATTSSIG